MLQGRSPPLRTESNTHNVVEEVGRPAPKSAQLLDAGVPGEIKHDLLIGIGLAAVKLI
jgi:hypothetical protein